MAKLRTGYVYQDQDHRWYARLTLTDRNGKRRNIRRRADTKTGAKEILKQLLREVEDYGEQSIEKSRMTFHDLAVYFEQHYLKPAEYVDGRKVAGVRSLKPALSALA